MHDQLGIIILVAARLAGLVVFAPVFAGPGLPARLRVLLVVVLAVTLGPMLAERGVETRGVAQITVLLPLLAREAVLGLIIGFVAALPLIGARMGGLMMGQQMGVGLAALLDPAAREQGDAVGRLVWLTALAGFVLVGGHERLMLAVLHGFERVPPGLVLADVGWLALLEGMLTSSFELALRVAAPLLALIMLESVAIGFVGRTVPQLNILSLGFPLRILLGLAVLLVGVTAMGDVVIDAIDDAIYAIAGTDGLTE